MPDENEPTVIAIWERLDPHDRKALADLVNIPEGQLALTRLSNVVLKLLGALGHVTQMEKAKILAEMEKAKAEIEFRNAQMATLRQQMHPHGLLGIPGGGGGGGGGGVSGGSPYSGPASQQLIDSKRWTG